MRPIEADSIDAVFSDGFGRSSDEASVMEVEQRAGVIRLRMINNRLGGRIFVLKQGALISPGWRERYESRGSRTVLRGAGVKFPGLLTLG